MACTEPQCLYKGALYLYLYLYSPIGPYGLYRTSVPVQRCTLPLPIPLLPHWAVRPVQNLSACTTVHFTFTYTSTPPIGRTACTEPQYLYNGALYLYLYLYFPYRPYGLYRASVPVQGCSLPYLFVMSIQRPFARPNVCLSLIEFQKKNSHALPFIQKVYFQNATSNVYELCENQLGIYNTGVLISP